MDRFLTEARLWKHDQSLYHVYAVPDLTQNDDLRTLLEKHNAVLNDPAFASYLAPVPAQWRHITIQKIDRPATAITANEHAQLIESLTNAVIDLEPFTVTAGPAVAGSSGVILDIDGDGDEEPFQQLHTRVGEAINSVLGHQATSHNAFPPHATLAYCTAPIDSGLIQSKLRRIRPARTSLTLDSIYLCDVTQDRTRNQYRWDVLHRFHIGR